MRQELELPSGQGAPVIVPQTFGSLLDFTPHAHALVAWELFNAEGHYTGVMNIPPDVVKEVFRHRVFRFWLDLDQKIKIPRIWSVRGVCLARAR